MFPKTKFVYQYKVGLMIFLLEKVCIFRDFWPGNTIPTHLPFKMQTFSEKISWTFPPFLLNDMNKVLVFIYIWVYILLNKCFISKMFKLYFWLNISQTSQHFSPSINHPLSINVNWAVSTHTYQYDWTSHWTDLAGHLWKWETRNSDVRMDWTTRTIFIWKKYSFSFRLWVVSEI